MHIYHRFWFRLRGAAWLLLLALGLVLGLAHPSLAHKVNVYAYAEGDQVKGEGYFPGGDKAQDSLVELLDGQGKLLGSTHTDSKGEFSLAVPAGAMPPLKVVLKASMGHQGDYTLGWGDRQAMDTAPQQPVQPVPAPSPAAAAPAASQGELEQRLGHLLDAKLEPLTAQIAKMNADRGVSVHDVVAGLGYILGLMGLAAYLKARR